MKTWISAIFLSLLFISSASAQQRNCNTREIVITKLKEQYQENLSFVGKTKSNVQGRQIGTIAEIYVNKEKGTFTVVMTNSANISCMLMVGEEFKDIRGLLD